MTKRIRRSQTKPGQKSAPSSDDTRSAKKTLIADEKAYKGKCRGRFAAYCRAWPIINSLFCFDKIYF